MLISQISKHHLRSLQASFKGAKCLLREVTSCGPFLMVGHKAFLENAHQPPVFASVVPALTGFLSPQQGEHYRNWPKPSLAC